MLTSTKSRDLMALGAQRVTVAWKELPGDHPICPLVSRQEMRGLELGLQRGEGRAPQGQEWHEHGPWHILEGEKERRVFPWGERRTRLKGAGGKAGWGD